MITAFLTTLEQMARILLFLVIGYGLNRLRILPKGAATGSSRLVTVLFLPALMLYSNMTEFNLADVASYGGLVLSGVIFWTVITLVVAPLAKKLAKGNADDHSVYLYSLTVPNTGAVGVPLSLALLGSAGLFRFNLFVLFVVIMTYGWGVGLFMEGNGKKSVGQLVRRVFNPVFVGMLAGLVLGALGAKNWMPGMAVKIIGDLSACYVPVSLISAGFAIADYPLGDVFKRPTSYFVTFLRLLLIPAVVVAACMCLGLTKEVATFAVLTFASPCGMNAVVYPASYGKDCKTGASVVLLSSLGAVLTVPLLYALVQQIIP